MSTPRRRLEQAVWVCHAALLAAATLGLAGTGFGPAVRLALIAVAAGPLLLAVPGLRRGSRRTFRWLALALVPYAGVAAAEVVATLGASVPAAAALLAALMELALLFTLSRAPRRGATHE